MDEKTVVEATSTPESIIESIKNGELTDLLKRVKDAQAKLAEFKTCEQGSASRELKPNEIAGITSLILKDMMDLKRLLGSDEELSALINLVIKAGVMQHGRMLGVKITEAK